MCVRRTIKAAKVLRPRGKDPTISPGVFTTDLAIGVPGENVSGIPNAGLVNVIYGTLGGLGAADNEIWHQDSLGVPDSAESGEQFGRAIY